MKIKIKDLLPNPFRRLKTYPIDQARVERLRQSIKHTGFWDNIVGRKKNGKIEIAYGHHRLIALQKEYSKDYEVDVIIKPLDDARMIQVMADENDDLYAVTPIVINETVRVARDFLREHPDQRPKIPATSRGKPAESKECLEIKEFLKWDKNRVREALLFLNEKDKVIQDEYEKFKTQKQAELYRRAKKKYPEVSDEVAKKIAKDVRDDKLATKDIKDTFREEKFKVRKPKTKEYLEDFVKLIPKINELGRGLDKLVKHKECIKGKEGRDFKWAIADLVRVLYKFTGKGESK